MGLLIECRACKKPLEPAFKFCPECGCEVIATPLVSLHAYLMRGVQNHRRAHAGAVESKGPNTAIARAQKNKSKWEAWADAVQEAIAKGQTQ